MQKILIIDDNIHLTFLLSQTLIQPLRLIDRVFSLREAYASLTAGRYDAVVVDRHLPDGDGIEFVEYLHTNQIETPALMISDQCGVQDRIVGLRKGADDYLGKPFSFDEFSLRVEKLLVRMRQNHSGVLQIRNFQLYPDRGLLIQDGQQIHLRKREFEIFVFLVKHKNMIVSREMLINNIWNDGCAPSFTTVDVYVRRIRLLLGSQREIVRTVRGYGYLARE